MSPVFSILLLKWGYQALTLAAALNRLGADARLLVVELVPAAVRWNCGPLGRLAGHPLADNRVTVRETDIADVLKSAEADDDAIILDVDNGPDGLVRRELEGNCPPGSPP